MQANFMVCYFRIKPLFLLATMRIYPLSIPPFFRPLYIREGYGMDTEGIRDKYGANYPQMTLEHAVTTLLIGLWWESNPRKTLCR